jgi:hypothetical protein
MPRQEGNATALDTLEEVVEGVHFTNLEELEDLARLKLPKMVETCSDKQKDFCLLFDESQIGSLCCSGIWILLERCGERVVGTRKQGGVFKIQTVASDHGRRFNSRHVHIYPRSSPALRLLPPRSATSSASASFRIASFSLPENDCLHPTLHNREQVGLSRAGCADGNAEDGPSRWRTSSCERCLSSWIVNGMSPFARCGYHCC